MDNTDWKSRYETLCQLVEQTEGSGVFPMGYLSKVEREAITEAQSDAYKCGWNDAFIESSKTAMDLLEKAQSELSPDLRLLLASGCCFYSDGKLSLNMNDTWAWALSWIPDVPEDQVHEVARLFRTYGNAGLMYWHSRQENNMRSEFHDNNRAIDFVANEERIRKEVPDYNKRAYHKTSYSLGLEEMSALRTESDTAWKKIWKWFLGRS